MDENKLKFGVGVLVISAIGIGIILTFLFGAFPSVLTENYTLLVKFPSAQGIGLNTNVVRDGVRIGRVADIKLRREGGVLMTLEMQEKFRENLTHRYIPQIGTGNLVSGDAQVEFVKGSAAELQQAWGADSEILDEPYSPIQEAIDYGKVSPGFFEMQDEMAETFSSIRTASESIAKTSLSVNELAVQAREAVDMTDSKVDRVADEAVAALEEFQGTMRDIRSIIGSPETQENFNASLRELPGVLKNAQVTLNAAQKTFESFERVGEAAEQTVGSLQKTAGNIEKFTEPLGDRGEQLVNQVLQTLNSADRAMTQVNEFTLTLNNDNGSLKRFLEDDELYWRIRRTVENVEEATARIRPILDDVRVFSDKIARDPRQLGVRGAVTNRPSGMGLK